MKRNNFDLSCEKKLSTQFGRLTPILVEEVLPGDSFKVNTEIMVRLAPMLFPVMHRVNAYVHYFYIPNRLLWDNWEDFITGGDDGTASPDAPYITYNSSNVQDFKTGTLADFLGFPAWDRNGATPTVTGSRTLNALVFKAYQKVYNDWYRDIDLESEIDIGYSLDGDNNSVHAQLTSLRQRAWEKDYFTSCRPTASKGPAVNALGNRNKWLTPVDGSTPVVNQALETGAVEGVYTAPRSDVTSIEFLLYQTVNDLRRANAIQEYLDVLQRYGSRYIEYLKGVFHVRSSDHRLQRAEYLGGGRTPISISEVLATAETTAGNNTQPGELFGHGIGVGNGNNFKANFEEHGFVMGILSIIPRSGYDEGLHRMWTRLDRYSYALPQLANIGEQNVNNRELFFRHDAPGNTSQTDTFGYQQRYAEYKFPSGGNVAGDMRFQFDTWHLNRSILAELNLNSNFVICDVTRDDLNRIFNVTDETDDPFWVMIYNKVSAIRPLPYVSIPDL